MATPYQDDLEEPTPRWYLRDLPFAARLTLAVFLISVGIGYFSALVQLHTKHADPGELMPTPENAVELYHGETGDGKPKSKIEALLTADPTPNINSGKQMRSAFTRDSEPDFEQKLQGMDEAGKAKLLKERDGERLAVLAWIADGASQKAYDDQLYVLPKGLQEHPITEDVLADDRPGKVAVDIQGIFAQRCVRCHSPGGVAGDYPLESFKQIKEYTIPTKSGSRMSLDKLAQTTHVHLLGFSMLYGLTGLIFAFTSYPGLLRVLIAPAALVCQVVDISCWWLARLDAPYGPMFAKTIMVTGGLVAMSLGSQILLTLFNLFGKLGKFVLVVCMIAFLAGAFVFVKPIVESQLESEKATVSKTE